MRTTFATFSSVLLLLAVASCSATESSRSGGGAGTGAASGATGCPANTFLCGSGECLATTQMCNGVPECADGSDESMCGGGGSGGANACVAGQFVCLSGDCVPTTAICSGVAECLDGSDESVCGGGGTTGGTGGVPPTGGTTAGGTGGMPAGGTGGVPPSGGTTGGGTGGIGAAGSGGTGGVSGGTGGVPPTGGTTGGGTGGTGAAGSGGTGGSTGAYYGLTNATAQSTLQSEYDSWKSTYFRDCGNGTACVNEGDRCVSEGVAYGMLLAVNMDDRDAFDKLWSYYTGHVNQNGVMNWNTQACTNNIWGDNGAADAELDAAMALIQADARWGGYSSDAQNLIDAIRIHETETCSGRIILKPGDAWGGCSDGNTVNPSYFSPGYYRVFAAVDSANASHWNQMATDTYTLLDQYQASMNGLICGWANLQSGCTSGFDWDGVRAPWRVATDYAWFGDADATQVLLNMSAYVDSQGGISSVPFDPNSAFRGSLALSGVATDQGKFDTYVSQWLSSATQDNAYFQATLRVLYLMLAAGQFPSTL